MGRPTNDQVAALSVLAKCEMRIREMLDAIYEPWDEFTPGEQKILERGVPGLEQAGMAMAKVIRSMRERLTVKKGD
jgi:hypothetical protein